MRLSLIAVVGITAVQMCLAGPIGTGSIAGVFTNPSPACVAPTDTDPFVGAECSGVGTSTFTWGDSIAFGTGPNLFAFTGENFSVPQFTPFVMGNLFYHNGTIVVGSEITQVDLQLTSTADDPIFNTLLTMGITVVQTPNHNIDPFADADFMYFTDHPEFGSFRVFEGAATFVPIIGEFDDLVPTGFGTPNDPTAGFISPSVAPIAPEPSTLLFGASALAALGIRRFRSKI